MYHYDKKLKSYSQQLRREMTDEERKLWYNCLRDLPVRFHRQKMIGQYIVDFYCSKSRLVIELDGSQHYEENGKQYDTKRDEYLSSKGIVVVRYSNYEINSEFDAVCNDIYQRLGLSAE